MEMSSMAELENHLRVQIEKALQSAIDDLKQTIMLEAEHKFGLELRQRIGNVAIKLSDIYSLERCGTDLLVHVKISNKPSP
jgi:hypothetical protein